MILFLRLSMSDTRYMKYRKPESGDNTVGLRVKRGINSLPFYEDSPILVGVCEFLCLRYKGKHDCFSTCIYCTLSCKHMFFIVRGDK